ncbi:MAG: hypothetical protein PWQ95_670 [Thermococcaceae archaeon]|nr:hypothetical protein [Thermococcaceae archaeon]
MNHAVLLLGQGASLLAKLLGAAVLAWVYIKHKRRPALCWSLAWISGAFSIVSDITGNLYVLSLSEALLAVFMFYGVVVLLDEEGSLVGRKLLGALSAIPLIISLYSVFVGVYGLDESWFARLGISYALSALFIFLSGLFLLSSGELYRERVRYLGIGLLLYGLHELDFPIMRNVDWFAPFGFVLGAFLTILNAFLMVRFVLSEEFIRIGEYEVKEVSIEPGVIFVGSEEYGRVKEELNDAPVLAFVRSLDVPPSWNTFFLTMAAAPIGERIRPISPTELPKIVNMSHDFLKEAKEKGMHGVVVLDAPEYLRMYNSFESLAKFLAALRDYVKLYNGTLIFAVEENAWDRRELSLLERLLR